MTLKEQPNNVHWEQAQEKVFINLLECLIEKPILKLPDHDSPFALRTDASNCGLGAAFKQEYDGKLYPIAYASKKLTSAKKRCLTVKKMSVYRVK